MLSLSQGYSHLTPIKYLQKENFQHKKKKTVANMVLIKHNAVRSKQHSFIAQLSARVQEVYYFASLVYRCQLHAHRAADVKNYEHIQYTVIINTKTDRKSKEIKHGAVKKKKNYNFLFTVLY